MVGGWEALGWHWGACCVTGLFSVRVWTGGTLRSLAPRWLCCADVLALLTDQMLFPTKMLGIAQRKDSIFLSEVYTAVLWIPNQILCTRPKESQPHQLSRGGTVPHKSDFTDLSWLTKMHRLKRAVNIIWMQISLWFIFSVRLPIKVSSFGNEVQASCKTS